MKKWWLIVGCASFVACSGGTAQGPGDPAGGDSAGGDTPTGDPGPGDPASGDPGSGDSASGDTMQGDPGPPGISDWTTPPLPFDTGIIYTTELYVTEGGNDSTGDGSMGMPLRTIGQALSQAIPGTRINVASGTYPVVGS